MVVASNPQTQQKFISCPWYFSSVGQLEALLCVIFILTWGLRLAELPRSGIGREMVKLSSQKWHSLFPSTCHWPRQVIWPYLTSHSIPREPKFLWPGLMTEHCHPLAYEDMASSLHLHYMTPSSCPLSLIAFHSLGCLPVVRRQPLLFIDFDVPAPNSSPCSL